MEHRAERETGRRNMGVPMFHSQALERWNSGKRRPEQASELGTEQPNTSVPPFQHHSMEQRNTAGAGARGGAVQSLWPSLLRTAAW
jgi:hypothetical protein